MASPDIIEFSEEDVIAEARRRLAASSAAEQPVEVVRSPSEVGQRLSPVIDAAYDLTVKPLIEEPRKALREMAADSGEGWAMRAAMPIGKAVARTAFKASPLGKVAKFAEYGGGILSALGASELLKESGAEEFVRGRETSTGESLANLAGDIGGEYIGNQATSLYNKVKGIPDVQSPASQQAIRSASEMTPGGVKGQKPENLTAWTDTAGEFARGSAKRIQRAGDTPSRAVVQQVIDNFGMSGRNTAQGVGKAIDSTEKLLKQSDFVVDSGVLNQPTVERMVKHASDYVDSIGVERDALVRTADGLVDAENVLAPLTTKLDTLKSGTGYRFSELGDVDGAMTQALEQNANEWSQKLLAAGDSPQALFELRKTINDKIRKDGEFAWQAIQQRYGDNETAVQGYARIADSLNDIYKDVIGAIDGELDKVTGGKFSDLNEKMSAMMAMERVGLTAQSQINQDLSNPGLRRALSRFGTNNVPVHFDVDAGIVRNVANNTILRRVNENRSFRLGGTPESSMYEFTADLPERYMRSTQSFANLAKQPPGIIESLSSAPGAKRGVENFLSETMPSKTGRIATPYFTSGAVQAMEQEGGPMFGPEEAQAEPMPSTDITGMRDMLQQSLGAADIAGGRYGYALPRNVKDIAPTEFLAAFLSSTGNQPAAVALGQQFSDAVKSENIDKIEAVVEGMAMTFPDKFESGFGVNGRVRNVPEQERYLSKLQQMAREGRIPKSHIAAQQSAFNDISNLTILPLPQAPNEQQVKEARRVNVKRVNSADGSSYLQ